MSDMKPYPTANWTIFRVIAVVLILTFLTRLLVTANEYPGRTSQLMTIAFDVMMLVGLVGLQREWTKAFDTSDPRRVTGNILFVLGLVAGVGILLIRLTSDAAWWTGHYNYVFD